MTTPRPSAEPIVNAQRFARRGQSIQFVGIGIVAITFVTMLTVSWRRWADVLIDFGRELYVPWRITQGDVLGRDLAVFFGPLSSYINAAWFSMFGVSLMTLAIANAVILAAFTGLLYWLLNRIAGSFTAVVGCVVFLMVFGFGHLQGMANYNFICPYSHELIHGTMLGIACIVMQSRFARTLRAIDAAGAGLLFGMTFLTKLEPFVATAMSAAAGWLLVFLIIPRIRTPLARGAALMAACAIVPPAVAIGLFTTAMPMDQAIRQAFGSWMYIGNDQLRGLPFYQYVLGTNRVGANAILLLKWTGLTIVVLGPFALSAWMLKASGARRTVLGFLAAGVALGALWWSREDFVWEHAAKALPLTLLAIVPWAIRACLECRDDAQRLGVAMLRLTFIVFAGGLLLKMILNARFGHYGFALAMPATLCFISLLMDWLPRWLDKKRRTGALLRGGALGVMAVWLIAMQRYSFWNDPSIQSVGEGCDMLIADPDRAEVVDAVVRNLKRVVPDGSTMTVLPEGVMLNYLVRIPAGTPYFNFLPPELAMFGEANMLASLQRSPPEYIAIVHRDSPEYGVRFFGRDFGVGLSEWIAQNYTRLGLAGDEPSMEGSRFGILVLKRKSDQASTP